MQSSDARASNCQPRSTFALGRLSTCIGHLLSTHLVATDVPCETAQMCKVSHICFKLSLTPETLVGYYFAEEVSVPLGKYGNRTLAVRV
mmetsp:Transcript_30566/g.67377  ORF Transcript_30566/g.67377 Transcript_30566/m.67377 type:complete len:89 (+) Transcript_30566:933-1199(+)